MTPGIKFLRDRYTNYKQSLHKKISPLSRSLGTAVDVHRNDLFVNRFPVTDHDDNSLAEANEDNCVPSNTSLHGPLKFTIVHEKQSAIWGSSSLREHSSEMNNLSHNTGDTSSDVLTEKIETVTYNFVDTGSVTELDTGAVTTGETITEGITELVDQAQKFGFSHEKFLNWMSSISNEFLLTQTIEYWLLAYASETVTDSWNEDYSPDAWLMESFSLKSANFIVNGVSEEYLKAQTPNYWINWAIYQFTNQASNEFISFVENASENRVDVFKNTPIIVTTSISDTSDKGNELNLLLETDLNQFNDKTHKSTWYYHTTDLISAKNIFTDGISLAVGQINKTRFWWSNDIILSQ
ncbi:hypothetical protein RhiirA4_441202 [Rhizophagus irregularis]|uniref:Uncharacterized protein n=1 Tax=Rhizophagus irregularis TaxID=588596 RepID=A0A2I1G3V9_9GLOM|nr:hypothetical protein RhiirA4_441202 [Rhizophagus irregularis]